MSISPRVTQLGAELVQTHAAADNSNRPHFRSARFATLFLSMSRLQPVSSSQSSIIIIIPFYTRED